VREDSKSRLMDDVEIRLEQLRCTATEYRALTLTLLVSSGALTHHSHKILER
jgi:hypothetical protein